MSVGDGTGWPDSGSFHTLCNDLNNADLSTRVKVNLVEAFCAKKKVAQREVIDELLRRPALFTPTAELLQALLSPAAASPGTLVPPARGGASPLPAAPLPAAPAGVSRVAEDVQLMPPSARERMAEVSQQQKELLHAYGKKEAKAELAELRGAPDPLDAPNAKEILTDATSVAATHPKGGVCLEIAA